MLASAATVQLVSVIIPCYNAQVWIRDALRSLECQGVADLEINVVDDGSTDDSAAIVQREFPRVCLIRTPNGGASRARNIGIRATHGEFIQFLDADDWLPENKVATQLSVLEQSGADVAYCDWQRVNMQPDGSAKYEPIVTKLIGSAPDIALFTDAWRPPSAYLFRRSIVEQVGGFNETLPIIQDARFAVDCALHGATFVYTPGIVVPYRMHSTTQNSKRDARAFNRDILLNAQQVQSWWEQHGGIRPERRAALIQSYAYVARSSYEKDRPTFEAAYRCLMELDPLYVPSRPRGLALTARLLGYRRAEQVALVYRHSKKALKGLGLRPQRLMARAQRQPLSVEER